MFPHPYLPAEMRAEGHLRHCREKSGFQERPAGENRAVAGLCLRCLSNHLMY